MLVTNSKKSREIGRSATDFCSENGKGKLHSTKFNRKKDFLPQTKHSVCVLPSAVSKYSPSTGFEQPIGDTKLTITFPGKMSEETLFTH